MERDQIIILSLGQLPCAPPQGIESLENLDPRDLISFIAQALVLITHGETHFNIHLPKGMASRHRLCTDMAHAVKRLGYDGECGYNQLLYPSHVTTRGILGFLVEKLPREEDAVQEEMLGVNALLNRRILGSIETWTKVRSFLRILRALKCSCVRVSLMPHLLCRRKLSCKPAAQRPVPTILETKRHAFIHEISRVTRPCPFHRRTNTERWSQHPQ